jgi:hypothetical protein
VKRADFISQVRIASRRRNVAWRIVRQGAEHEIWACGPVLAALPRHRELRPGVVHDVRRKLEQVLGKDWWK